MIDISIGNSTEKTVPGFLMCSKSVWDFTLQSLWCYVLLYVAENAAREAASREAAAAASGRSEYGPPPPSVIAPPRQTSAEARIQMVQQEEDDEGVCGELCVCVEGLSVCVEGCVCVWHTYL